MTKVCGVYRITNVSNGKCYVGKSLDIRLRWTRHLRELAAGTHHSQKLQRAYDKYGADCFKLQIVLQCDPEDLLKAEDHAIQAYNSYYFGYNATLKAGRDATGIKRSPEFCQKISDRTLGIKRSEETKEKMRKPRSDDFKQKCRERQLGVIPSDETRARLSESHLGNTNCVGLKASEETKQKMSMSRMGHSTSAETRQKISKARKGQKVGPMSEENKQAHRKGALDALQRLEENSGETHWGTGWLGKKHSEASKVKMSNCRKGSKASDETRKKQSEAKKGKPGHKMSEEAKEKIRQARILYWLTKKGE